MKRLTVSTLLSLLAAAVLVLPATAGLGWCRTDPWVELNGALLKIYAAVPIGLENEVTGPVVFTITTPRGVSRRVVHIEPGFNGQGEEVVFERKGELGGRSFPVRVDVTVRIPNAAEVPVLVEVYTEDGERIANRGDARSTRVNLVVTGDSSDDKWDPGD